MSYLNKKNRLLKPWFQSLVLLPLLFSAMYGTAFAGNEFSAVPVASAYAETKGLVNFTFGKKYDGAALADPATPEFWNSLYSSKNNPIDRLTTIFDANGRLISGASVRWSNDGFTINGNASSFNSKPLQELMSYYDVTSTKGVINLEGLDPGMYDLYIYSQVDKKTELQALSVTVNYLTFDTIKPESIPKELIEGENYVLANISTDESGVLSFEYAPGKESTLGVINAFQLRYTGPLELSAEDDVIGAVPEPSGMILLLTGLLTLAIRQKWARTA